MPVLSIGEIGDVDAADDGIVLTVAGLDSEGAPQRSVVWFADGQSMTLDIGFLPGDVTRRIVRDLDGAPVVLVADGDNLSLVRLQRP